MKNSKDSAANPEPADLDLPDWTGMDESTARLRTETAFELPELYRSWFPELAKNLSLLDRPRCEVEFVL